MNNNFTKCTTKSKNSYLHDMKGILYITTSKISGPGSSVGIATDYGLEGPGSNPGGGQEFPPVQTGPGAHPASCKMGTGSFPAVKGGRGVLLTTHPLLVPRSLKSKAIPVPTLWATPGLKRDQFSFFASKIKNTST